MKHGFLATLAATLVSFAPVARADRSTGEYIDDNTVNASVKAALIADKTTKAHESNVETYKGVVQLSGFVESDKEKDAASQIAQGVDGVKEVRNNISVGPKTSMSEKLDDSVMTGRVK